MLIVSDSPSQDAYSDDIPSGSAEGINSGPSEPDTNEDIAGMCLVTFPT